jgi:hypothetical protein
MIILTLPHHERVEVEIDGARTRIIYSYDDPEDEHPPPPVIVDLPTSANAALAEVLAAADEDRWAERQRELPI